MAPHPTARSSHRSVEQWLDGMSVQEQIGQMSQIDLQLLLNHKDETNPHQNGDDDVTLNRTKLEYYIGTLGIGSVLNNVVGHAWNASQFRSAIMEMQRIAQKYHRPPIIYGLDTIHGANYIQGATLLPQPLNMAATFNTTMAYRAGVLGSRDTRAAGITWLFAPLLGIGIESRWSRIYETFGEDMIVVGSMAKAMIQGIQTHHGDDDDDGIPSQAAASAKHFIGYSAARTGHDRAPSWIPSRQLYQYFVPPWRQVVSEVYTIMEAYTEYNGVPTVTNRKALQPLLRFQLGFDGLLVTDYSEVWNLVDWHHISKDKTDAVVAAIGAGIDMSMIPFAAEGFCNSIQEALDSKKLNKDQIRNAARRVLTLKEKLNMFDEVLVADDVNLAKVGTDREEALNMARQSIVLVKNQQNTLPLSPTESRKVLITGPTADSLAFQSGGWTWQWQGAPNRDWFSYGTTVLEAARELPWNVTYQCGTDILGNDCDNDNPVRLINAMKQWNAQNGDRPRSIQAPSIEQDFDCVIVCVGEENYTEKLGD
jgi:beta-glucosidase